MRIRAVNGKISCSLPAVWFKTQCNLRGYQQIPLCHVSCACVVHQRCQLYGVILAKELLQSVEMTSGIRNLKLLIPAAMNKTRMCSAFQTLRKESFLSFVSSQLEGKVVTDLLPSPRVDGEIDKLAERVDKLEFVTKLLQRYPASLQEARILFNTLLCIFLRQRSG